MIEIEASTIGPEITKLVVSGGGRVLAVVSNGIYLESFAGYVVAIVDSPAVNGPLSLRVSGLSRLLDVVSGQQNLPFRVSRHYIQIGTVAQVSLHNAKTWVPSLPDRLGPRPARNQAAQTLAEAIAGFAKLPVTRRASSLTLADLVRVCHVEGSEDGEMQAGHDLYGHGFFAALRATMERWPFESHSAEPAAMVLKRLAEGILRFADANLRAGASDASADMLVALLGLGEGLTPAGDDLVSGIMAALVWQARLEGSSMTRIEHLRDRIRESSSRTNRISARLLYYAAEGVLYAPAMALGAAILVGDAEAIKGPARSLFTIGNTSGVDVATGILVGCLAVQGRDA